VPGISASASSVTHAAVCKSIWSVAWALVSSTDMRFAEILLAVDGLADEDRRKLKCTAVLIVLSGVSADPFAFSLRVLMCFTCDLDRPLGVGWSC